MGSATNYKMFVASGGVAGNPGISVEINSMPWPQTMKQFLVEAYVHASISNEASTCTVVAIDSKVTKNPLTGKFSMSSEFDKVKVGAAISVKIGREGKLEKAFKGFISNQEVEVTFKNGKPTTAKVTITAMDVKMWMMTSKKTEVKKQCKKFSQAVSNVISSYADKSSGNKVKVSSEKESSYICQSNESDYEFICRLGHLAGALFYVFLGKVYFITPKDLMDPVPPDPAKQSFSISPDKGILDAKMSANVWGTPSKVSVIGVTVESIDGKKPSENILGEADKPSVTIGKGKDIGDLTKNLGDANVITILDPTITDKGEADAIASAEFTMRSLRLATLRLETAGINCLALGDKIEVSGFGEPIDNTYMLMSIEHVCDIPQKEYKTILELCANKYTP